MSTDEGLRQTTCLLGSTMDIIKNMIQTLHPVMHTVFRTFLYMYH